MKRKLRAISAIMVIALLLVSVLVVAIAAEQDRSMTPIGVWIDAAENGNEEAMAVNPGGITNVVVKSSDSTMGASFVNSTESGFNKYLVVYPEAEQLADTAFVQAYINGSAMTVNKNNPVYEVVEFDISTQSVYPSFLFNPMVRYENGTIVTADVRIDSYDLGSVVTKTGADWVHVTYIADIVNNCAHIFVDGQLVSSVQNAIMSADAYSRVLSGTKVLFQGLRLELTTTAKYDVSETVAFDNFSGNIFTSAADIAAIKAALNSKDLSSWSGFAYSSSYVYPKSIDLFDIDGVRYKDASSASKALSEGGYRIVNVLSDFGGILGVSCPATVYTNGCIGQVEGVGYYTLREVDDLVYESVYTIVDRAQTVKDGKQTLSSISANSTDHRVNAYYDNGTSVAIGHLVGTTAGDEYAIFKPQGSGNITGGPWYHLEMEKTQQYIKNGEIVTNNAYSLVEFDIATGSELLNASIVFITNNNGANSWSRQLYFSEIFSASGKGDGEWMHVTILAEFVKDGQISNKYTVFVDGVPVLRNLSLSGANDSTNAWYWSQMRIIFENRAVTGEETLYLDNLLVRSYNSTDSNTADLNTIEELASAYSNASIDGVASVYGAVRQSTLPQVACVDGRYYASIAELARELKGLDYVTVEIIRDIPGVTLNASFPGVIKLSGHDLDVNVPAGFKIRTQSADSVEIAIDSNIKSDNGADQTSNTQNKINSAIKHSSSQFPFSAFGNWDQLNTAIWNMPTADYFNTYLEITNGAEGNPDDFLQLGGTVYNLSYSATENTFVALEFDIATSTTLPSVAVQFVPRGANGGVGGNPISIKLDRITSKAAGQWSHVIVLVNVNLNQAVVYVDGVVVDESFVSQGAFFNDSAFSDFMAAQAGTYNWGGSAARIGTFGGAFGENDSILLDNVSLRYCTNDSNAQALVDVWNIASGEIIGNNVGGLNWSSSYVYPVATPLAEIDGVIYDSVAKINAALAAGDGHKVLQLVRNVSGIVICGETIVYTNGLVIEYTVPAGYAVSVSDGVIKVEKNYTEVQGGTDKEAYNAITGNGNVIFTGFASYNFESDYVRYISNYGKDSYLTFKAATVGKNTSSPWMHVNMGSGNLYLDPYDSSKSQYYAIELDIATDTKYGSDWTLQLNTRSNTYGGINGSTVGFNTLIPHFNDGEWNRVTLIADVNNNVLYVFVNGSYVTKVNNGVMARHTEYINATAGQTANKDFYLNGLKINLGSPSSSKDGTETLLIDNLHGRKYSAGAGNITSVLTAGGLLSSWNKYNFSASVSQLPPVAMIDGIYVYTQDQLEAELNSSYTSTVREVEIFRNIKSLTVNNPAIIDVSSVNGVTLSCAADLTATLNGGVYTVARDRYASVSIVVNGTTVYTAKYAAGKTYGEIIADYGAVYKSGKDLYAISSWSLTNGGSKLDKSLTVDNGAKVSIYASATKVTGLFVAHKDGELISTNGTTTDFINLLASTGQDGLILDLNGDVVIPVSDGYSGIYVNKDKTIYLNGYSIIMDETDIYSGSSVTSGEKHMFLITTGTDSFSIYGPGAITKVKSTTGSIFFSFQQTTAKVYVENVAINACASIVNCRDGNYDFIGCRFDIYSPGGTVSPFNFGEGRTSAEYKALFRDCSISYRGAKSNTVMFNFTSDNLASSTHRVKLEGCDITSAGNLFNSNCGHLTISIRDTKIIGATITTKRTAGTVIVIGEGVRFSEKLDVNSSYYYTVKDGLVLAYTGDAETPYCYTDVDNVATVSWGGKLTEYWVGGSTPINNTYSRYSSSVVEAGRSYTFTETSVPKFTIRASLTLYSDIDFNIYLPVSITGGYQISGFSIDGVEYVISDVEILVIEGVEYYHFIKSLAPAEAAKPFAMMATIRSSSGAESTIARTLSVPMYAETVFASGSLSSSYSMIANSLDYIRASAIYFGNYAGINELERVLSLKNAVVSTAPQSVETDMSAVSDYIVSCQLNVQSALVYRFNLGEGSYSVDVTVDLQKAHFDIVDGMYEGKNYVEFTLRAYDLTKVITVTVTEGDSQCVGTTAIYSYYSAMVAKANSSYTTTVELHQKNEAANAVELVKALYSYAKEAEKYKSSIT